MFTKIIYPVRKWNTHSYLDNLFTKKVHILLHESKIIYIVLACVIPIQETFINETCLYFLKNISKCVMVSVAEVLIIFISNRLPG